jgi:hypothetical protein
VDGNIASCADLGARGARAAGLTISAGRTVVANVDQCRGDFAACVRLGLAAADAGASPSAWRRVTWRRPGLPDRRAEDCLALGRTAAQAAGFRWARRSGRRRRP